MEVHKIEKLREGIIVGRELLTTILIRRQKKDNVINFYLFYKRRVKFYIYYLIVPNIIFWNLKT
jgi:hypothetical protein